jgi:hypothetical protein
MFHYDKHDPDHFLSQDIKKSMRCVFLSVTPHTHQEGSTEIKNFQPYN